MKIKKMVGIVLALVMVLSIIPITEVQASIFDEMSNAVQIEYDANVSQTIDSVDDADWFKFTTADYAANYTITVSNFAESSLSSNHIEYRVYDGDGNCLYTHNYGGQKNGTENYKFDPKTVYYLRFSDKYSKINGAYEYAFKVTCQKEEADSRETAKKIGKNKSYTGQIFTESDEDWYKFTTPKYKMTYSLEVSNQSETSTYRNMVGYRVYDADKNCIYDGGSLGSLKHNEEDLTLDAGKTYYIQFYSKSSYETPYEYVFKLNAKDITSLDKANVSKVSALSKGFKVSWEKVTDATGYEVRYSTKKSMSKAKKVTVKSASKKITGLKSKTTYYVQVRAYAKLSTGKKLYSKWSSKKTVKTK
jgi:hypothetical protein